MEQLRLARVVVWPVADPKRQVHLAMPEWQVRGLTICGLPTKGEPTMHDAHADSCRDCYTRARQLDNNTPEGVEFPKAWPS